MPRHEDLAAGHLRGSGDRQLAGGADLSRDQHSNSSCHSARQSRQLCPFAFLDDGRQHVSLVGVLFDQPQHLDVPLFESHGSPKGEERLRY